MFFFSPFLFRCVQQHRAALLYRRAPERRGVSSSRSLLPALIPFEDATARVELLSNAAGVVVGGDSGGRGGGAEGLFYFYNRKSLAMPWLARRLGDSEEPRITASSTHNTHENNNTNDANVTNARRDDEMWLSRLRRVILYILLYINAFGSFDPSGLFVCVCLVFGVLGREKAGRDDRELKCGGVWLRMCGGGGAGWSRR